MFNVIPPPLQRSFCYLKLLTGVALLQKIQVQQKCFVFDLFCKVKFVNFRNLASLLIFIHSTYTVCCFYVVSHFGIDSLWSLPRLSDTVLPSREHKLLRWLLFFLFDHWLDVLFVSKNVSHKIIRYNIYIA